MVEVAGGGGGGASSSDSDGTTYNIKPNSVPPPGEEQSMQYPEIMAILHNLKPKDVASAGDAFKNLANVLDSIATDLANTGNQLSSSWQGAAAQAAMNKFQQLHDQAAQLAANAHNTASVAYWLGNDVLPQYQSIPSPEVMSKSESDSIIGSTLGPGGMMGGAILGAFGVGSDGTGKANNAARGYLASLNGHIATGIQQLPNYVSGPNPGDTGNQPWQTPPRGGPGPGYGSPVTGYSPGGYGGGAPPGGGGGMPLYSPPGGGRVPPPKLPSGSGGPAPTGTLQGYSSPPGGGTPPPFGGGSPGGMPGGGSANPFSRLGMMPGGGPGGGGPGEGLAGDAAAADGAVGDAAAADGAAAGEAAGAAGAEGAEGAGMAGMPMGGSGSGQQDKERQRQAWMHEDEDIWGVPKDDVGPVIG